MILLTLIQKNYVNMIILPDKKEGRYYILSHDGQQNIIIDGLSDSWKVSLISGYIQVNQSSDSEDELKCKSYTVQNDSDVLELTIKNEKCILIFEPVIESKSRYKKYGITGRNNTITIGRDKSNVISINDKHISGKHAAITFNDGVWEISDNHSLNGTYVNNIRINEKVQQLHAGDVVFIFGYKFIIGSLYIAANIDDQKVTVNSNVLTAFKKPETYEYKKRLTDDAEENYFSRTLRIDRIYHESSSIKVLPPESKQKKQDQSLLIRMGPSVTMCSASILMAGYSVMAAYYRGTSFSYVVPSLIMAGSMALSSIAWPVVSSKCINRKEKKDEKKRKDVYSSYLSQIKASVERALKDETEYVSQRWPVTENCAMLAIGQNNVPDKYLWSQNIDSDDFMSVVIGKGNIDAGLDISCGESDKYYTDDSLINDMTQIVSYGKSARLENVPVSLCTGKGRIFGINGDRNVSLQYIRSLIVQLTALCSYDELKLVFIYNKKEEKDFEYAHWLPHVWNTDRTFRYIISSDQDVREFSYELENEIDLRKNKKNQMHPYLLIISADMETAEKIGALSVASNESEELNIGFITIYNGQNYSNSDYILDIKSLQDANMYDMENHFRQKFTPDIISGELFDNYIRSISNIRLDICTERYKLPSTVTFLEMFRVSKVEHLNSFVRWKENNPIKSLRTEIGIAENGEVFYLDLHEKYHGPHGLIAGTTGSGKSESIITLILSLAVNYSPDEVAFVIIDYKGGGLADAFEGVEKVKENGQITEKVYKLPHLAGTVTNLDGGTVGRSKISIESEIKRRQQLFKIARSMSEEGTMDIYKYQKLRRNGLDIEPLPHLFIVCDEFAELKDQQPDFMDLLISTARIGRSLGVHLILATQKPDGVVGPQIWSNSRFKICLKVQDKSDSMCVINRPEAAEISTTGRFYLQVGYNEFFSMGQSAWCGADYIHNDNAVQETPASVTAISNTGSVIGEKIKKSTSSAVNTNPVSQLVKVREYIIGIDQEIQARQLWLPPVPSQLSVRALYDEYEDQPAKNKISPVIGKWDDIVNRRQSVMTIPFSDEGNLTVFGSAGSGMEMFFTSLIYSLVYKYLADEVNIYIFDFDSGFLKIFEKAPQIGDVVFIDDEENVITLFSELKEMISLRSKLFSPYGGEYSEYCRRSGQSLPDIVIILNNYASFMEQYDEYIPDLTYITREGPRKGIYTVIGSSSININSRVRQNFKLNYMLKMNDESDYSMILGRTGGLIPSPYSGRGLFRAGKIVYEFQTADIFDITDTDDDQSDEDEEAVRDSSDEIEKLCDYAVKNNTSKHRAKSFTSEISQINADTLITEPVKLSSVPVGIDQEGKETFYYDFSDKYITFVSSESVEMLSCFAGALAHLISADSSIGVTFLDTSGKAGNNTSAYNYIHSKDDFIKWNEDYRTMCVERDSKLYKDENGVYRLPEGISQQYIIINSFRDILDISSDCLAVLIQCMIGCEIHNIHYVVLDTPEKMNDVNGCYSRIVVGKIKNSADFDAVGEHEDWFDASGIWLGSGITKQQLFIIDTHDTSQAYPQNASFIIQDKKIRSVFYSAGE